MRLFFIVLLSAVHSRMFFCKFRRKLIYGPADIMRCYHGFQRHWFNLLLPVFCQNQIQHSFRYPGKNKELRHLIEKRCRRMYSFCSHINPAQLTQFLFHVLLSDPDICNIQSFAKLLKLFLFLPVFYIR